MKILFMSDTHGMHIKAKLVEADVIVHTGDITGRGSIPTIQAFLDWYSSLDYKHKILVPGNHDFGFEGHKELCMQMCDEAGVTLLIDEEIIIDGVKFYGTPSQKPFCNWAFNDSEDEREFKYGQIPLSADVLLVHGPPYGILDKTCHKYGNEHVGDRTLLKYVKVIKPKICAFGHIHEGWGIKTLDGVKYINSSVCDENYKPVQLPICCEINKDSHE